MRSIGIRELRQNASQYIRMVKAGETIEVTERGVPVAVLGPCPKESKPKSIREDLIERGLLIPGTQNWKSITPVPARPGAPSSQEVLDELREERL